MSLSPDAARRSRLATPEHGVRLLFADLHNHSTHSDGRGDPQEAFQQLRDAGLDVAALTDHASIPLDQVPRLSRDDYPSAEALSVARYVPRSIDAHAWKRTAELADTHDVPGEFTALRGFEWTEPWLGHVNVWFSEEFVPVTSPGRIDGLHDFLADVEPEALFGYNHPGREPGRFGGFARPAHREPLIPRMVALEAFNRADDFLFEGFRAGAPSPIAQCLDAGWQPGLIGCSDEHGHSYGLVGKGRTGLWAPEHSRTGVRDALRDRRAYATREVGLRVDATLDGVPMGTAAGHPGSTAVLAVDLDGSSYHGHAVQLQLLTSSSPGPDAPARRGPADGGVRLVHRADARVGEVTTVDVTVPDGARWLVLRVADPSRPLGNPHPVVHAELGRALAYASPWYLG